MWVWLCEAVSWWPHLGTQWGPASGWRGCCSPWSTRYRAPRRSRGRGGWEKMFSPSLSNAINTGTITIHKTVQNVILCLLKPFLTTFILNKSGLLLLNSRVIKTALRNSLGSSMMERCRRQAWRRRSPGKARAIRQTLTRMKSYHKWESPLL